MVKFLILKQTLIKIIKKMNNEDPEFITLDKLVELYNKKDYGVYEKWICSRLLYFEQ